MVIEDTFNYCYIGSKNNERENVTDNAKDGVIRIVLYRGGLTSKLIASTLSRKE